MESVYCAVRTESLYNADTIRLRRVNGEKTGRTVRFVSYSSHDISGKHKYHLEAITEVNHPGTANNVQPLHNITSR